MFYNNGYNQDWSTLKKLVWLRGNPATGQIGTDLTVSGTPPLSLPNSLGKPLKAWEVDVLPKQDLNGYDAPWPAGGGKNKLSLASSTLGGTEPRTKRIEIDAIPAGTYVFTTTNTGTETSLGNYGLQFFDAVEDGSNVGHATNGATFALTGEAKSIYFYMNSSSYSEGKTVVLSNMMIRPSSISDDTYAPYSNLCPILGTDKLNMFVEESYDQSATPKAVLTLPQTVYTGTIGSEGGESSDAVYEFDENLTWQTWGVNNQVQGITGFYFYRSNSPTIDFTNINVAVGTNWLPINNRVWGGGAVGYYTNNTNVNPAAWYEMIGIENSVAGIADTDTAQQAIDKFKAFIAVNPLQVRFGLVTPVQYSLTSPTIPTPTGTATTWATAEDGTVESMEVTYIGKA